MYKGKKYSIDTIRESMSLEGYTLLSTTYSSTSKLRYKCNYGHEAAMLSCNWNKGRRCPECKKLKLSNTRKKSFKEIELAFIEEGYKLISKVSDYVDNETKLEFICPKGHNHAIAWTKWQQGRRCIHCKVLNMCGPKHFNWRGGVSFEPYCPEWRDKEYKKSIRERDNNTCLNPYCYSNNPMDLTIHHIDYDKKNCSPTNLITVCRSCNSMANKDRKWHSAWYSALILTRYGGTCYGS